MTIASLKALSGGAAIAIVAAFALAPSAQAACMWTGYAWDCASAPMIAVVPYQNAYVYPPSGGFYVQGYMAAPPSETRYPGPSVR